MTTEHPFCGEILLKFGKYYLKNISRYANVTISIFGVIFNLFNLSVFIKKATISSPNFIFTNLAFVDFLASLANIPFQWLKYFLYDSDSDKLHIYRCASEYSDIRLVYEWAVFFLFVYILAVAVPFMSTFLTIILAIWRYIATVHPLKERRWCCMRTTCKLVITGYIISCFFLALPLYLSSEITGKPHTNQTTIYTVVTKLDLKSSQTFLATILIGRLVLLGVLSGCTFGLIQALSARKAHDEQLTLSSKVQNKGRKLKMEQHINRSILILLTVLILVIIAELPKGIQSSLRLYHVNVDHCDSCLSLLEQICDTITLINTSIPFIVYYTMSKQFKTTFKLLFNSTSNASSSQQHAPLVLGNVKDNK